MEPIKKLNVALYARVSTDEQKDNKTIENQKIELKRYAEFNNLKVYEGYYDNGVSGVLSLDERPQGSKMLKKVVFVFHQVLHEIRAVFKIVHEVELFNV